jgi:hypothetical protein
VFSGFKGENRQGVFENRVVRRYCINRVVRRYFINSLNKNYHASLPYIKMYLSPWKRTHYAFVR